MSFGKRNVYTKVYSRMHPQSRHRITGSGSGRSGFVSEWGRVFFLPLQFLWLELLLHIHMNMSVRYFLVWMVAGFGFASFLTIFTLLFSEKTNFIVASVLSGAFSLVYVIEMFCKKILQTYYPVSILGVAAENRMDSYLNVVISTVLKNIHMILLYFLPSILFWIFARRVISFARMKKSCGAMVLGASIVLQFCFLLVTGLPWKGDLTPKMLRNANTNIDDQVEQLGLFSMLRLDLKHMVVPAETIRDDDFEDEFSLEDDTVSSEKDTAPSILPEGISCLDTSSESVPTTGDAEGETGTIEQETEVLDTSPQIMDVDLESLTDSDDDDVSWLAKYFLSKTPTNKNAYTGMFEGYNVIFFTLEGFSGYGISEELTPTLYKLQNEGFVFENFYTPLHYTSTSGGECQNLLGLYPKDGNPITMKRTGILKTNCYFSLAQQLGRLGYVNLGYHGNTDMYGRYDSHTNLGYTWKQFNTGLELEMKDNGTDYLWPQRDKYVIEASVDDYINSDELFNIYYLTISGHMPYSWNRVASQYKTEVENLPYSDTTKAYLATCIEVDKALETLLDKLEEAGKLENTLIIGVPDHVPYFNVDTLEELAGKKLGSSEDLEYLKEADIDIDVYRSVCFLWSASMEEPVKISKVCGQVDVLPTVSNLLGLEYDSRMLSGSDALSDSEGLVVFHSRNWKSDRGYYNRYTGEFTLAEGVSMTDEQIEEYVTAMKKKVSNILACTEMIVETDFYDKVFG